MPHSSDTRIRRVLTAVLATALAGTVACEPATSPGTRPTLDASTALADYQAMDQVFSSDGWTALQALGGRTPMSAQSAVAALRTVPQAADAATGRAFAADFMRELVGTNASRTAFAKTVISPVHRGRTFVYDAARDQYVVDAARSGAPANGVRFVLYEVDGAGRPIVEKEVGYADVVDEGVIAGETIKLRLVVVERQLTRIDYRTSVLLGAGTARIDVSGFALGDDGTRLNFTVGAAGEDRGGRAMLDLDFDLAVPSRDFRIDGTVRGLEDGRDGDGTVQITARHGAHSFRVDMQGDGETVDGTIFLNGARFVTVSGDASNPTLLGASGQPITEAELRVVRAVIHSVDDVFDLVEDLVKPVGHLLLLGWIL